MRLNADASTIVYPVPLRDSRHRITTFNPATGEELKTYQQHTDDAIEHRLISAHNSYRLWRQTEFSTRRTLMERVASRLTKRKDDYARLMTLEMGKPIKQARSEIEKCAQLCRFYAEHAERFLTPKIVEDSPDLRSEVHYAPIGTVFAVMPWNFPFWQVMRFAVPTLMAGNVAVLKHASNVTGCALAIEELFRLAGLPSSCFSTLVMSSDKVAQVIEHETVKAVTLTGSESAGIDVATRAGANLKKSVLELGGSDPFVVLADADISRAARQAAVARTINSGQSCIAAKRFIVERSVFPSFTEKLVEEMKRLQLGNPLDPLTDIGPLARNDLREELRDQVSRTVRDGATLRLGGHSSRVDGKGYFYTPTVLEASTDDPTQLAAFREETFGPVALVIPAKDVDEAMRLANSSRFGLGASIWTTPRRGQELAAELEAGNVFVNRIVKSDPTLPFGGIKKSGYGRELASEGIREFVNVKTVRIGS